MKYSFGNGLNNVCIIWGKGGEKKCAHKKVPNENYYEYVSIDFFNECKRKQSIIISKAKGLKSLIVNLLNWKF